MTGRRVLFGVLFAATMAGSLALMALALSPGGFGIVDYCAAGAVRGDVAVDGGRILERHDRISDHALCAGSDRGGDPDSGRHPRGRGGHGIDRDPGVHPQRTAGADDPQSRADAGGLARPELATAFISTF